MINPSYPLFPHVFHGFLQGTTSPSAKWALSHRQSSGSCRAAGSAANQPLLHGKRGKTCFVFCESKIFGESKMTHRNMVYLLKMVIFYNMMIYHHLFRYTQWFPLMSIDFIDIHWSSFVNSGFPVSHKQKATGGDKLGKRLEKCAFLAVGPIETDLTAESWAAGGEVPKKISHFIELRSAVHLSIQIYAASACDLYALISPLKFLSSASAPHMNILTICTAPLSIRTGLLVVFEPPNASAGRRSCEPRNSNMAIDKSLTKCKKRWVPCVIFDHRKLRYGHGKFDPWVLVGSDNLPFRTSSLRQSSASIYSMNWCFQCWKFIRKSIFLIFLGKGPTLW